MIELFLKLFRDQPWLPAASGSKPEPSQAFKPPPQSDPLLRGRFLALPSGVLKSGPDQTWVLARNADLGSGTRGGVEQSCLTSSDSPSCNLKFQNLGSADAFPRSLPTSAPTSSTALAHGHRDPSPPGPPMGFFLFLVQSHIYSAPSLCWAPGTGDS